MIQDTTLECGGQVVLMQSVVDEISFDVTPGNGTTVRLRKELDRDKEWLAEHERALVAVWPRPWRAFSRSAGAPGRTLPSPSQTRVARRDHCMCSASQRSRATAMASL
ncbi:hypothetical protein [Sphaerisporangium rhizosphaerae]|uniref:Uncharacterized protein n=1 Tax=Sphaerisporangium rhizosphaerae TaxID=2269375 RepID=A0ABW2PCI1_9ACTN